MQSISDSGVWLFLFLCYSIHLRYINKYRQFYVKVQIPAKYVALFIHSSHGPDEIMWDNLVSTVFGTLFCHHLLYFLFLSDTQRLFHPGSSLFLWQNTPVSVILPLPSVSFPSAPSLSSHLISSFPMNFTGEKRLEAPQLGYRLQWSKRHRGHTFFLLASSFLSSRPVSSFLFLFFSPLFFTCFLSPTLFLFPLPPPPLLLLLFPLLCFALVCRSPLFPRLPVSSCHPISRPSTPLHSFLALS